MTQINTVYCIYASLGTPVTMFNFRCVMLNSGDCGPASDPVGRLISGQVGGGGGGSEGVG